MLWMICPACRSLYHLSRQNSWPLNGHLVHEWNVWRLLARQSCASALSTTFIRMGYRARRGRHTAVLHLVHILKLSTKIRRRSGEGRRKDSTAYHVSKYCLNQMRSFEELLTTPVTVVPGHLFQFISELRELAYIEIYYLNIKIVPRPVRALAKYLLEIGRASCRERVSPYV